MKKQTLAAIAVLTLILTNTNFVNAQETKKPVKPTVQAQKMQKPNMTPEQRKALMEKRMQEFNKTLGLSDEQIAQAKTIRQKGHKQMKPLIEKRKAKIEEWKQIKANDKLSTKTQDKKIETIKNDLKKINQDMHKVRIENENEFKSILTQEQKAKYEQIKAEGRKHYKEHKKPQGPENFKHKPPMKGVAQPTPYKPAPVKK